MQQRVTVCITEWAKMTPLSTMFDCSYIQNLQFHLNTSANSISLKFITKWRHLVIVNNLCLWN